MTRHKGERLPCPVCGAWSSSVLPWTKPKGVEPDTRRRRCDGCGTVYETREVIASVVSTPPLDTISS